MGKLNLQIILGKGVEGWEWFLQVSLSYVPGLFGRLLGKQPSGTSGDTFTLARTVQDILSAQARFSDFRWCWDGDPAVNPYTSEPVQG